MPPKAPLKAKSKAKIKIKVKKLSKKQLENKAKECLKNLQDTYKIIQTKFKHIINGCTDKNPNKEKLKKDLYEAIHNISILLSKAVPLELRNSPNDRSKQLKKLLDTWIKESSSTKNKVKSISYTSIIKSFIETCLTPEGKLRFSRTKKNSDSLYRALDVRNIINPTADDTQCDIAFDTNQWPATHTCYICGLCLHNMQSDNCGAPCEHLLNIYQVMITFGFIETEDRIDFDIKKSDKKNIYAPSCTCCNSEKSSTEFICFQKNGWKVNEGNIEKILKKIVNSERDCCYKHGHPEKPEDSKDDQAVWVLPSKTIKTTSKTIKPDDYNKCSTTLVPFPGEKETQPLYNYSDTAIENRTKEIVNMLKRRVDVLNAKVPRPKVTNNLPYLNAIIQIATFFTHISLNAYRKMATEMAGRTDGGAPPAAGAGDDNIYELCSDADADCFDIEVYENIFKKEFENHFWEEFEIGVTTTRFVNSSKIADANTDENINSPISTLSTNNTKIINISNYIPYLYKHLLEEDNTKQEDVEKEKKDLEKGQAKDFKDQMLEELLKPESSEETDRPNSPIVPIIHPVVTKIKKGSTSLEKQPPAAGDFWGKQPPAAGDSLRKKPPVIQTGQTAWNIFGKQAPAAGNVLERQKPQYLSVSDAADDAISETTVGTDSDQEHTGYGESGESGESQLFGTEDVQGETSGSQGESSDNEENEEISSINRMKRPSTSPHSNITEQSASKRSNSPRGTFLRERERPQSWAPATTNEPFNATYQLPKSRPKSVRTIPNRGNFDQPHGELGGDYGGGKKTRKSKVKKQNKTRKQKPKKQTKRISYVKNKQTRKNKKRIKKSNSKKAT